jgi:hypothetical protein
MPRASLIFGLLLLGGCRDIDRFDTGDGEAYCGTIVTAPFVREGFATNLRVRLKIDTDRLDSVPGTITTDDLAGPCTPAPLFQDAELRVTPDVLHDPISTLEFGEGRDMNLITWAHSGCQGPMLAVVSLMKNDDVELRLLKPPSAPLAPGEDPGGGYGLFQLRRQEGTCGF